MEFSEPFDGRRFIEDRNGFEIEKTRTLAANRENGNGYTGDVLLPPMDVRARLYVRDEKRDPVLFRRKESSAWLEENQATKLREGKHLIVVADGVKVRIKVLLLRLLEL